MDLCVCACGVGVGVGVDVGVERDIFVMHHIPIPIPLQVIVDLRGPQAKLLTRLDEINYEMEVRAPVLFCWHTMHAQTDTHSLA